VIVEAGDHGVPFFVVKSGELEIVRTLDGRETIRRIEENPKITLHTHTEIVALEG
jgi:hypothetical protein